MPPPVSKALCGFAMAKEQSYAAQQSSQSRRILWDSLASILLFTDLMLCKYKMKQKNLN